MLRSRSTSFRLIWVAPTATGSRAIGIPFALATAAAMAIASALRGVGGPMFKLSAPAIPTNSAISSNASDMIGEAPRARIAFAVNSRTTELVKDSTKGVVSLKVRKSVQTRSAVVYIRTTGESERERAETSETRENATSPHRDYPARLGLTSEE